MNASVESAANRGTAAAQQKEIVSAMVKMNSQGLQVPIAAEDLKAYFKKLPNIPHTGAKTMKKKHLTDFGPVHSKSIILDSVFEESD